MPTAGNIEAIRDWVNRYYYKKSEVNKYFTRLNEGLTAYALTLIGHANEQVTLTELNQQSPQTYTITLNSDGIYQGLFFFNTGSTLAITGRSVYNNFTLTSYVDSITLTEFISLLTSKWQDTQGSQASITVNGCSDYDYLLVISDVSNRNSTSEANMRSIMYTNEGTELAYCGGISTTGGSSMLVIVNKVPVTADTMTLTGAFFSYQVYGVRGLNVKRLNSLFATNGSDLTQVPVGADCSDCAYLLPIFTNRRQNGVNEQTMRNNTYYTGKTEIGYSGGYLNSSSSSRIAISYLVPVDDPYITTLTGLSTGQYVVLGLY